MQHWILDHLFLKLTVKSLASRTAMSVRNFTRVFQQETGITPADFVEIARVDSARCLLEDTDKPLQAGRLELRLHQPIHDASRLSKTDRHRAQRISRTFSRLRLGSAIRVAVFGQTRSVPIFAVEPASYFAVYREDLDVDPDALKAFVQQNSQNS